MVKITMHRKGISFGAVVEADVWADYMPDILAVRPISKRTGKPTAANIVENLDSFELYQVRTAVLAKLKRMAHEDYRAYRESLADD